jgi:hypothetical protein
MNSIMERRVQACQRELVDRTPVWNQSRLLHALRVLTVSPIRPCVPD